MPVYIFYPKLFEKWRPRMVCILIKNTMIL